MTREEKIAKIVFKFGHNHQYDKTVEEVGEFLQALSKFRNAKPSNYADLLNKLVEETADLKNMIETVAHMCSFTKTLEKECDKKLDRTMERYKLK